MVVYKTDNIKIELINPNMTVEQITEAVNYILDNTFPIDIDDYTFEIDLSGSIN